MNNKLNQNFSLRKLLLSALVAGPLAVLPAPLWALPDITVANLTQSSGVTIVTGVNNVNVPNSLNITSPDKAILTWGAFSVGSAETINYLLPASTSSVLNNVTGGARSDIAGSLTSNGNVYLLNPSGILISKTASINTGGFYASTVSEPSSFFSTTGSLNFTGGATADVTLESDNSISPTTGVYGAPTIQAVGTGNNIVLAGKSVLVEGANFYGNVKLQSASNGVVNLAQSAGTVASNGGNVNVNRINGLGGNLNIVTQGGSTSLTGTPVAASLTAGTAGTANATSPVFVIKADGTLAFQAAASSTPGATPTNVSPTTVLVAATGSGYAPNSQVSLSITAPLIRQSLNSSTTASTAVGTTATGYATTDSQGRIVSYTLTSGGSGYITTAATSSTTASVVSSVTVTNTTPITSFGTIGNISFPATGIGQQVTVVPTQVGFTTNVAGNTTIDTTGATSNGAVNQGLAGNTTLSRFTSTGGFTVTTGLATNTNSAGNITMANSNLSTATLPLVGTVNIIEADGFSIANSKLTPNGNSALTLRTLAGNISMASGARVEIVPSVVAPAPTVSLTASTGGITYSSTGSLTLSTLSTTTASAGVANISATGNITIGNYSSPGLTLTATGGDIITGALSTTQGAANQVAATLSASGNISVNGNINTTGRVAITSGGFLNISGSNTALMTAGAGLNLKATGNISLGNSTVTPAITSAGISAGTDVVIESTAGSVSIPGGFAGAGSITAAQDLNIGTSIITGVVTTSGNATIPLPPALGGVVTSVNITTTTSVANLTTNTALESSTSAGQTFKYNGATIQNMGGLYAPNTTIALQFPTSSYTVYDTTPAVQPVNNTGITLTNPLSVIGNVTVTPSTVPTGYATTNGNGQITGVTVTNPGSGIGLTNNTLNLSTFIPAPTNAIVAGGTLALKATNGTVTVGGPIVGTGSVSITSANNLSVPAITAPTLSLVSTAGSIAQAVATTAVISTGTTTLNAATSATLDNATNDFGSVVVLNSPSGATLRDVNALVVANGTDAKGNLTVTSGVGLTSAATTLVTVASPNTPASFGLASLAGGSVTGVTLTGAQGSGYAPNSTPAVTFSAPVKSSAAGDAIVTAASTAPNKSGWIFGSVGGTNGLAAVVLANPVGYGFVSGSEVPLTVAVTGAGAVAPTAVGVVNGNGQIASVKVLTPGTSVASITGITVTSDAPIVSRNTALVGGLPNPDIATGYLSVNSLGQVTGVVITNGGAGYNGAFGPTITMPAAPNSASATFNPVATGAAITSATIAVGGANYATAPSIPAANGLPAFTTAITNGAITSITPVTTGGIQIGSATTDVVKVAGALTLTSAGPTGSVTNALTATTTNYSEVTTVSNSVAVTGAVSLNTTGANAFFGAVAPLGTTPTFTAGSVGGSVGTGLLTVIQSNSLNLAAVTAGSLKATSVTGDITNSGRLAINGITELTANSIFAPGKITLSDTSSNFGGTITVINGKDIEINSANSATSTAPFNNTTTVQVGSTAANGVISGGVTVKAPSSAVTISVAGTGNLTNVGFSAGGAVSISDGANTDGLTLVNATNTGTGTVNVNVAGPITLGSGIKLNSTGLTTITATGAGSTIKDSGASASAFGPVSLTSGNDISLTATGHSFGPVSLSSGNAGAVATTSNIVYTEAGTARLNNVSVNPFTPTLGVLTYGSLTVSSTAGSIDQLAGGTIVVPSATGATNTVSFSAPTGAVILSNAGNNIAPAVAISAVGNSSIIQSTATPLVLGNVAVTAGTFTASTVTPVAVPALPVNNQPISQATGTTARIFGATSFQTNAGKITMTNSGNNFGGLTLTTTNGTATGAAVALTEGGTLNLIGVDTGTQTTSTLALTSENAAIISTATPLANTIITTGGAATLVAKTNVALDTTQVFNTFTGGLTITAGGNVAIQDRATTTTISGGTSIGGSLTVRNTQGGASAQIKDSTGNLNVLGAVTLGTYNPTTGAVNTAGSINISSSTASFGAVKFNSGAVTIAEAQTLNLAAGSTAAGAANLSSGAGIVTSGIGGGSFSSTLSLSANGNITITNPIFVSGGLTFRSLGTVDLKSLSVTGNLNGVTPVNLGAATYVAPSP